MLALIASALALDDRLVRPPGGIRDVAAFTVVEDADGWIWFASVAGLHRYDGARSVRWGGDYVGEPIEILAFDGANVVVLDQDRHVYALSPTGWAEITGPAGTPLGGVRHAASSEGAIWVLRDEEVWRRDPAGTWTRVPSPGRPRLVRTAERGAWLLLKQEIVRVDRDGTVLERHAIPHAMDVATLGDEGWVVTYDKGIWRWDRAGLRWLHDDGQWGESVIAVPGGAWAATTGNVHRFDGDALRVTIPVPQGIPQHDALALDREGTLWLATLAGPRMRPSPETTVLAAPGNKLRGITQIGRDADRIWATTWVDAGWFGPDRRWHPSDYTAYEWPFCTAADGTTWTLAAERDEPGKEHVDLVELRGEERVHAVFPGATHTGGCAPSPVGGLWVGTSTGLHHLADGALAPVASPLPGLAALLQDSRGVLHLFGWERECHADARAILAGTAEWACAAPWRHWPPARALEVDGRVWAGGAATGLLVETPAGWVRHVSTRALVSPTVTALVGSRRGGVWILGPGGAVRVEGTEPATPWTELEALGAWAGLPESGAQSLLEDDQDGLWIATDVGLAHVPAESRAPTRPPPAPVIVELRLNGEPVDPLASEPLVATWPQNQIEIRAASATYRDRSRLVWRAQLRDDDRPLTASPDPTLRILDLPAGTYGIVLQASVDGGATWSPASRPVVIQVRLPWYLRPPAMGATAFLLVAGVYSVHRARLAAVSRVERERNRIAMDLHDDLGAGLSTIAMLTGLAADGDLDEDARREVAGEARTTAATLADSLADIVWTLRRDAGRPGVLARSLVERGRRLFASGSPRLVVDVAEEWPDVTMGLVPYRNVQLIGYEALQNVARHADAREVTLRLHPFVLEVSDDGRGLSAISPRAGTGTGLAGMRDRAAAIGAKLEVLDRPGGGTLVRLTFAVGRRGRWR